jgi:hypothetical protein
MRKPTPGKQSRIKRGQTLRTKKRSSNGTRKQKFIEPHTGDGVGFKAAFDEWVNQQRWQQIEAGAGRRRGPAAQVALPEFLMGLVYHFFSGRGLLSEHLRQLFDLDYSDSAASERRQAMPWEVFVRLMRAALRPLARKKSHPEAFYRGLRLVAIDGVQFSLNNTPAIKRQSQKAKSRRGKAAFAKIGASVLLELGLHNPLAAAMGRQQESESSLARRLLAQLPAACLLLGDRLHGYGAFLAPVLDRCLEVGSHFLIRVQQRVAARRVKKLPDGSCLVDVDVRDQKNNHRILRTIRLREIKVQLKRPGFHTQQLRLWTSLLPWKEAPAMELAELYTRRWEHEWYFRQLKSDWRRSERLQSQTVETAAQEIAAWIISSALLAQERARAAKGIAPVLRVSFGKLLDLLRPLWVVLRLGADLLDDRRQRALTKRVLDEAAKCLTPKRRTRSCPREVRQPIGQWPRLKRNRYSNDPVRLVLVK